MLMRRIIASKVKRAKVETNIEIGTEIRRLRGENGWKTCVTVALCVVE